MLGKTVLERGDLLADTVVTLLLVKRSLAELLASVVVNGRLLRGLADRVGTDGLMSLLVHGLHAVSGDTGLDVLGELALEGLGLLSQLAHVVSDVSTIDVLAEDLSIKSILLLVETREALLAVRNVDTTIDGTLEGSEDLGTSAGAAETNIKEGLERTGSLLHIELGSFNTESGQSTAGTKETSAVGSGVVSQTNLDTIGGELMGVGRGKDHITLDLGVDELADNVGVGDTNDETVLGGVVLVLVLDDQALAGVVVSLTLTATTVLNLETLEVGGILNELDKSLCMRD